MALIAISRGSLTAAERLAQALGEKTGSRIVSREEVIRAAERYGIGRTGTDGADFEAESLPPSRENRSAVRRHYLACFKAALLDFAAREPLIYHGNLAHVLLNDVPFVLRVRVNAPRRDRIGMLMAERGYDRERAAVEIAEADRRRRRWVQFLYDTADIAPVLFDLVIDMSEITLDEAVRRVSSRIRKSPFRRTGESVSKLFDLRLAACAEVRLLEALPALGSEWQVEARSAAGLVTVRIPQPAAGGDSLEAEVRNALRDMQGLNRVTVAKVSP